MMLLFQITCIETHFCPGVVHSSFFRDYLLYMYNVVYCTFLLITPLAEKCLWVRYPLKRCHEHFACTGTFDVSIRIRILKQQLPV